MKTGFDKFMNILSEYIVFLSHKKCYFEQKVAK